MAHFAQLDENNIVTQVIVVHNNELLDENGVEQESKGIAFCQSLLGGNWKQTSYNANMRKNYAGIGYIYDPTNDVFYTPSPYPSWTIDTTTWTWQSPIPCPTDGTFEQPYSWDETTKQWIKYGS